MLQLGTCPCGGNYDGRKQWPNATTWDVSRAFPGAAPWARGMTSVRPLWGKSRNKISCWRIALPQVSTDAIAATKGAVATAIYTVALMHSIFSKRETHHSHPATENV